MDKILVDYHSRSVAAREVLEYVSEHGELGKEFLSDKNIKTKDKFDKYLSNRQAKLRKPVLEKRRAESKKWEEAMTEQNVNNIMGQAETMGAAMDREVERFTYIENALKRKFGKDTQYITGMGYSKDRQAVVDEAKAEFDKKNK